MGADIKSLRSRIRSVDSTLHLTSAMGLVASSKIRRANESMIKSRDYSSAVKKMIDDLTACPECQKSPFMKEHEQKRIKLVVIAGDRGLCGGYNANVFRIMREYPDAEVIAIGKRAFERFGGELVSSESYTCEQGYELSKTLCREFADEKFDKLGIVSSKYISVMAQEAQLTWLLPLHREENAKQSGILFEPNEMQVLNAAVVEYVFGMLMSAVRESFACEVAARRMAMDSAGKNAQQMLDDLQLEYNRARQGAITQEITEIVAGSGG